MDINDDQNLAGLMGKGDEKAFELLFRKYYQALCLFSKHLLNDDEMAEETVQDVFVKIWHKRENIHIESSVKHYLFQSVRNHCYNQLQHKKIRSQYVQKIILESQNEIKHDNYFIEPGLKEKIEKAVGSLPPRRQEIFILSREEGLKYKEIAERLNISIKTVEAQMGLALKYLRDALKDFTDSNSVLFFILMRKSGS